MATTNIGTGTGSSSGIKPKINLRSTAVKRIMQEASELSVPDVDDHFVAAPLEVCWFTVLSRV
jgi:ubiquitin-conjugating enzyme E2 J1